MKRHISGVGTSATLAINEKSQALQQAGRSVIRFGFGQSPFPVPQLVVDALRDHASEKAYLPVKGLPALRAAVAGFITRTRNLNTRPDQVLVGPGSKELIYLLQLCLKGTLYLPTPSWVSYAPQSVMTGNPCKWIPCSIQENWKLTAARLDAAVDTPGFVILNYPNNPSGAAYSDHELHEIAEVARARNVIIIADEIYNMLRFDNSVTSVATHYPEGTIITSGLSKWCGAGGWRLGIAVFPGDAQTVLEQMAILASETFTAVNAPLQYAAIAAYSDHAALTTYRDRCRKILDHIARYTHDALTQFGVACKPADGGFYLFPDFSSQAGALERRGIRTSNDLCLRLLDETGVALLPGSAFGCAPGVFTARLAFVDFDGEQALKSPVPATLTENWMAATAPNIVEGVKRLCQWLRSI
ncbi:MAG: aminotransferase class I/II-fold pyridoxal phosphate-dependent enzyme [Saprospiraceae bacterium]|nr:aminotransferase class I/II-fold pyridoxal phosphate-dependent enzyme [Saprospiraceae bacterium]